MTRISALTATLVTVALLSACGWQLRGNLTLDNRIDRLQVVSAERYSPMDTALRERLEDSGVTLVEDQASASHVLEVNRENRQTRIAGVGADALASAFEITLSTSFDFFLADGTPLGRNLTSSVTRSFNASADTAGSGSREEELILEEMRRELAQQMLRRVQALVTNQPTAPDTHPKQPAPEGEEHGETSP
mgnify:FL=1